MYVVYMKTILYFIIMIALGILYEKFKIRFENGDNNDMKTIIDKYLLKKDSTFKNKPFLWIHKNNDINSKKWLDFGSRNTTNENSPYIELCIIKLIKTYGDYFNVVIVDDDSFKHLIPSFKLELNNEPYPQRKHIRRLMMLKLVYLYGGIVCPKSFFPLNDGLIGIYKQNDVFAIENRYGVKTGDYMLPSIDFIGGKRFSPNIKPLISFLENLNANDYTNEQDFLSLVNRHLKELKSTFTIKTLDGKLSGVKDCNNNFITVEDLASESRTDKKICSSAVGVFIPYDELEKRTRYNWITYLSKEDLLKSNTLLGDIMKH